LVYRMLRYGMKYVDQGAAFYEAQHRQVQIKQLKWKAAKLGFRIVQASAAQRVSAERAPSANVSCKGEPLHIRTQRGKSRLCFSVILSLLFGRKKCRKG